MKRRNWQTEEARAEAIHSICAAISALHSASDSGYTVSADVRASLEHRLRSYLRDGACPECPTCSLAQLLEETSPAVPVLPIAPGG